MRHVREALEGGILVETSVKGEDKGEATLETKVPGTSATARAAGAVEEVRAAKVAGTSATARAAGAVEEILINQEEAPREDIGAQTIIVVNRTILVEEGIRARVVGVAEGVSPTPAFFIRPILRFLWRRVPR